MHKAMQLIEDMDEGDPNNVVGDQLREIEQKLNDDEYEMFGDLWESYLAKL